MKKNPRKLWGGRFRRPTAKTVEQFTHSLAVDERLAKYDLRVSMAHARMLGRTNIISKTDSARVVRALGGLLRQVESGRWKLDPGAEDVHTAIQAVLEKKVGPIAHKLHAGRSRNDLVVTSFRLLCKDEVGKLQTTLLILQREICAQAEKTATLLMPGMTHLRHAQPVLAAHILLSYCAMLERDRLRLMDALDRMDELPLGSGALTGTGLPIDRRAVARELGFSRISENSVDAVTDRDFAVEILSALSLLGVHLSRIAEELLFWSTQEFGFVRFGEQLLTGSSMMPQKQNPDFLELTRGGSSQLIGGVASILTLLKGLPSGYQRDLQLDKEIFFPCLDKAQIMVLVVTEGFRGVSWNKQALQKQLEDDSLYATDLAEYLVLKGVPFGDAHRRVGQLLAYAEKTKTGLRKFPLAVYRRFCPDFSKEVYGLLDPMGSVRRKISLGSTNPAFVKQQIRRWKKLLRVKV